MKKIAPQAGFTLVELLLYMAISSTLLVSISAFLGISLEARVKNQTIVEVDQQGALALDSIARAVRGATSISAPAVGASGAALNLVMPDVPTSPTVFDLSAGTLRIKEGSGAVTPLTNGKATVSNLTIKNLSRSGTPGIVQVSLTISRTNPSNRNEYSYTKTFTTTASIRR